MQMSYVFSKEFIIKARVLALSFAYRALKDRGFTFSIKWELGDILLLRYRCAIVGTVSGHSLGGSSPLCDIGKWTEVPSTTSFVAADFYFISIVMLAYIWLHSSNATYTRMVRGLCMATVYGCAILYVGKV